MSTISTHVLDTVPGKPAVNIFVRLERLQGGWVGEGAERVEKANWIQIATGVTDANGRCSDLMHDAPAGVYRMRFEVGTYFKHAGRASIYPEISVTFTCGGEAHYHLPLLLSDNSYTTYRGS